MAYHDYRHTTGRSRSPINRNARRDSPDRNIQVLSSHVSAREPGYQPSSEGYGYSQNFENYNFYDTSGYPDYSNPYAQSGHDVHHHYDYTHSYAQYNEPQYSSQRRDFYGYQHYEQQQQFHRDVPCGFGADMQPNRQAHNMAPFHRDVHDTIKMETGESKTVPNPDSNLRSPPQPTRVTTIKKEVEVVEILSSDEDHAKDNAKNADSNTSKKKMFPLFTKGYKPPTPVAETESDDGDILIPVLVRKRQLELYCDYEGNMSNENTKDGYPCAVFSIREESGVKLSDPNVAKKR